MKPLDSDSIREDLPLHGDPGNFAAKTLKEEAVRAVDALGVGRGASNVGAGRQLKPSLPDTNPASALCCSPTPPDFDCPRSGRRGGRGWGRRAADARVREEFKQLQRARGGDDRSVPAFPCMENGAGNSIFFRVPLSSEHDDLRNLCPEELNGPAEAFGVAETVLRLRE
ncbi:hypothetical protein E5288_WYG019724 [Bos mutus]|uniref:Uncharacterized protein n=1 Tax=Bos mutus TaxID=72004 RepID=A0A6B0S9N6_9CETA|nr:hypothetical protein [Bos mutus]